MRAMRMGLVGVAIIGAGALALDSAGLAPWDRQVDITQASAVRSDGGTYDISWQGADGEPVDIYVSARPDAPRAERRLLVDDDTDGKVRVTPPAGTRPYFYLAADKGTEDGAGVWTAERVLPLEGGRNFRDLGGYPTADGHHVKWGMLYRSGAMSGLTPNDYAYLSGLGIRVVCDLRAPVERQAEPNRWAEAAHVPIWTRDYDMGFGNLGAMLADKSLTAEKVRQSLKDGYRRIPYDHAPSYRVIFAKLVAGEVPLAFNCSGGKDRAGVGSALILSALGVPRDIILADYAMSAKLLARVFAGQEGSSKLPWAGMEKLPADVRSAMGQSDPEYLRAAFDEIEKRHGSVENYLRDELGVTSAHLATIRQRLLD